MILKKRRESSRRDFMQIHTPPLSGNQRQASSSPKNCHPVVTKGKESERDLKQEGERIFEALVEKPHTHHLRRQFI